MWTYEKRLQFSVKIIQTCSKTASLIISQLSGSDGELAASMRRLSQRYAVPCKGMGGLLADIGIEELAHLEMICAITYQLTKNLTPEQAKIAGSDAYYIDHITVLWPAAAVGVLFNACELQSRGDAIIDPHEDLVAEQKARIIYDNLIRIIENLEAGEPLRSLRTKEVIHFQRLGEALEKIKFKLDEKNFYYLNPEFDKQFVQSEK